MSPPQSTPSDGSEKSLACSSSHKDWGILNSISSLLGLSKPSPQFVNPKKSIVWLLDNTAYQPVSPNQSMRQQPWYAEVIACIFERTDDRELGKLVAAVTDFIGLDGEAGADEETRERIARRLRPFLRHVLPDRLAKLEVPLPYHATQSHTIGPSNQSGITSQVVCTGSHFVEDGARIEPYLHRNHSVSMKTTFSAPEGWLIVSDIDDTIKITKTSEQLGMIHTTFAEEFRAVDGMSELYSRIQSELLPTWFYVSASPYNLYPFLHEFLHEHFSHGTMILRDISWRDLGSLFQSLTEGTQEYKVDRIEKIHRWFPRRRAVCIGDSTQTDPETYAEIYKKHPDWVQAILIRKVTDIPNMEDRNSPERFKESFKDVPDNVWKVFENPDEMNEVVNELGTWDTARR